jgi:hypothetical protein
MAGHGVPGRGGAGRAAALAVPSIVILLCCALALACSGVAPAVGRRPGSAPVAIVQDVQSATTAIEGPTPLDGLSLEQIVAFRRQKVADQAGLAIFPADYDPLRGSSSRIWTPITPRARWLGPTPYYVANPYVLVVFVNANHVTPLNLVCPEVAITSVPGRVEERRQGASARCWLDFINASADQPGVVRAVILNAFDAGFRFAHLDRRLSANVRADPGRPNLVNGLFSQSSFFHFGHLGKNNISPEDPRGWIRLEDPRALTRLHVKLWRQVPASIEDPADQVYEATIAP